MEIDITTMSIEELDEFVRFLRDTHEIIDELNEKYDEKEMPKNLYQTHKE
jgi:hypothetical protein